MPKVIFMFAGTGDTAVNFAKYHEQDGNFPFEDDVVRIYISGCQDPNVGGGFLQPNLNLAANNVRKAFTDNTLSCNKLLQNFKTKKKTPNVIIYPKNTNLNELEIDRIAFMGFSRGALTGLVTAQKLNDLNIPMDIIANQPVPGVNNILNHSVDQYQDLSACHNIKTALTFVASHSIDKGSHNKTLPLPQIIHNIFFSQMVTKFPGAIKARYELMPHQHHWGAFDLTNSTKNKSVFDSSPILYHIDVELAKLGYTKTRYGQNEITNWYETHPEAYFTPPLFAQKIYGLPEVRAQIQTDSVRMQSIATKVTLDFDLNRELKFNEARAILALQDLNFSPNDMQQITQFILRNDSVTTNFIHTILEIYDTCTYLQHQTKESKHKSNKIQENKTNYMSTVFMASYKFLLLKDASAKDIKDLEQTLQSAGKKFVDDALDYERGTFSYAMKYFTILLIKTTRLIAPSSNTAFGNWLFFPNRSVKAIIDLNQHEYQQLIEAKKTKPN